MNKKGKQLIDSAEIFEKCVAFFLVLQAQDRVKQVIYGLRFSLNYGNDGYELVFSRMAEASEPDSEQ